MLCSQSSPTTTIAVQSAALLKLNAGKSDKSPREGFPVFVGSDLYAVKWHNWKAHFIWQDSKNIPKVEYSTVATVVNLIQDPREERQVVEPYNAWIQYPGIGVIVNFKKSQALQANIPMGAPNNFVPATLKRAKH